MRAIKSFIFIYIAMFSALFFIAACREIPQEVAQKDGLFAQGSNGPGLTIAEVDKIMEAKNGATKGPSFDKPIQMLGENENFSRTPMGAYLNNWLPEMSDSEKISVATSRILNSFAVSRLCTVSCSPAFKKALKENKKQIQTRLEEVTINIAENEIRNNKRFTVFYHAFPNGFRLYQDVLRALKSFEFLTPLTTTYPFRDFAFKDARTSLPQFLEGWWQAYLDHAKKEGVPPFPHSEYEHKGASVGLTFFPDSISYAMQHVLATNVNFLGNNLIPLNSSVWFFLNSTSATGLDIANELIEYTLTPYLLGNDGTLDKAKLKKTMAALAKIFDRAMVNSAGQVAQIFVENRAAPDVAYPAWNGGEPLWLSKNTGTVIMAERKGIKSFKPTNVFWPTTPEQKDDYKLFNIDYFMDLFINDPVGLRQIFPAKAHAKSQGTLQRLFDNPKENKERLEIFITQDYAQARVLPNPKYFTDQNVTGVKIYTLNPVSAKAEELYNQEIFALVRDIIGDFLANAKDAKDFKEGTFKLKSAFIDAQENKSAL